MILSREAWEKFYYNMTHPNEESIKARDNFLAEHRNLNVYEILKCLGVEDDIKEWFVRRNVMSGYPNLMCFGYDLANCDYLESCPNYKECNEAYYERYFSFMESKDIKDWF